MVSKSVGTKPDITGYPQAARTIITGYPLAALTSSYWFCYDRLLSKSVGIKLVVTGYPRGITDFLTVQDELSWQTYMIGRPVSLYAAQ